MYVSIGATKAEVMDSCPNELEYLMLAYQMQRKRRDEADWVLGMYIESAVATAIEHNFAGRKAKSKYVEKPLMQNEEVAVKTDDDKLRKQREMFMAKLNLMKANFDLAKKEKEVEENAEHS